MSNIERQNVWKGLAVCNFSFGGAGAGVYFLVNSILFLNAGELAPILNLIKISAPILVILGLLCVAAEAGSPKRGANTFKNMRSSWMSRESTVAVLFIILSILEIISPIKIQIIHIVTSIVAIILLFSQGSVIAACKGIPAWNTPLMPILFLLSGLASGGGIIFIGISILSSSLIEYPIIQAVGIILIFNLITWIGYLSWPGRSNTIRSALDATSLRVYILSTIGIGHLIPMALIGLFLVTQNQSILVLAGGLILVGVQLIRYVILIKGGILIPLDTLY